MATYPDDSHHHSAPGTGENANPTARRSGAVGGHPGIRPDRVAEVRLRLAGGYYHAVTVRHKIADGVGRVLRELDRL